MGAATAMKIGVEMEITMKIAMTLKPIQIQLRITAGKRASTTSVSFENRFMMRPRGVVSKNDIGKRTVLLSSPLCRLRAALKAPRAKAAAATNKARPARGLKMKI